MNKQKKTAAATDATQLTDDEKMYLEVMKGVFLEALVDEAIYEIQ